MSIAMLLLRRLLSSRSGIRNGFILKNPPRFNPGYETSDSSSNAASTATQHTYREDLYSAGRKPLANPLSQSPAMPHLKRLLHEEGVVTRLRERKRFVKPSVIK